MKTCVDSKILLTHYMKTRFSWVQNIFRSAGYIIKIRIYIFNSSLLLPVRWQAKMKAPGSSPAELLCLSPAGLPNRESQRQHKILIWGFTRYQWHLWYHSRTTLGSFRCKFFLEKIWRIKNSKRQPVRSGHSVITENKISVHILTFFKFLKDMVGPQSATSSFN